MLDTATDTRVGMDAKSPAADWPEISVYLSILLLGAAAPASCLKAQGPLLPAIGTEVPTKQNVQEKQIRP